MNKKNLSLLLMFFVLSRISVPVCQATDLSAKGLELFTIINTNSISAEDMYDKFGLTPAFDLSVKDEVVAHIFDLDLRNKEMFVFSDTEPENRGYTIRFIDLLITPKSAKFLRCIYLKNILSPDARVRRICLTGLTKIDLSSGQSAALMLLGRGEQDILPFVIHVLISHPDEAIWFILQKLNKQMKESPNHIEEKLEFKLGNVEIPWSEKVKEMEAKPGTVNSKN